jgi:hypothetical protein
MRLTVLFMLLFLAGPAPGVEPPGAPDRLMEWVHALGHRDYQVRERAEQQLLAQGRTAYAAVLRGAADDNAEVRLRCRRLLPLLFDLELKARLDQFAVDVKGKQVHDLPGWERFRRTLGEDRTARDFYAAMVRADGRLMEGVENGPAGLAIEKLLVRCSCLQQRLLPASGNKGGLAPPEVGQLLFLGLNPQLQLTTPLCTQINQMLYRQEVRGWFSAGTTAPLMKKLLLLWLERNLDEPNTGYLITNLLNSTQLPELTDLALKVLLDKRAPVHVRASMLISFGKMGQKEVIERIQPLIADETLVSQFAVNQFRGTTLLGDVALAMSVHLSGQKVADYGFEGLKISPASIYSYYRMGFAGDKERLAARQKWKEWRDRHKP